MTTPDPEPVDTPARPPLSRRALILLTAGGIAATTAAAVILAGLAWPGSSGSAVFHTGTAHYVVTVTVANPRVGASAVEIDVGSRSGGPADPSAVTVQAVMPQMGHADPLAHAVPTGGGRYHADGVPLMMPGQAELLLSLDYADGVDHLTLPLTVGA